MHKSTCQYINDARSIHGDRYGYDDIVYKRAHSHIQIRCFEHGVFEQKAYSHLQGHGCPECKGMKSKKTFLERAQQIHKNRYDYSRIDWRGAGNALEILCAIHGSFSMIPTTHVRSKQGCPACAGRKMDTAEYLRRATLRRSDIGRYDLSHVEYINSHTDIKIVCLEHGSFWKKPSQFYTYGCSLCSTSGHHSKIEASWLTSLKIEKEHWHSTVYLQDGIGRGYVFADAFVPSSQTIYEFYGDYWHGNPRIYDSGAVNPNSRLPFGELYRKTKEKEQRIVRAGFNLVTIWESDFKLLKDAGP